MTDYKRQIELTLEAFREAEEASDKLFGACHDAKGAEGTLEDVINGHRSLTPEDVDKIDDLLKQVKQDAFDGIVASNKARRRLAALRREL